MGSGLLSRSLAVRAKIYMEKECKKRQTKRSDMNFLGEEDSLKRPLILPSCLIITVMELSDI